MMKHVRYRFLPDFAGGAFRDWATLIFGDDCPRLGGGVPLLVSVSTAFIIPRITQ